jgi:predicted HAD superfamily Cof-like phosphohydrolase|tara:strand:- start:12461 stop:12841 length:381 start_codon:yes stop_codon:yes gene_type:complete
MLKDIEKFHEKFGFEKRQGIQNNKDLVDFRIKFLEEELNEFKEAIKEKNDAKALDALVDLTYVAIGTAYLFDYPFHNAWEEVQKANMAKIRQESERSKFDVIKPKGWKAPDIEKIMKIFKYWKAWT